MKIIKTLAIIGALSLTLASSITSAAVVGVFGDRFTLSTINDFYAALPGTTSSIISTLTPASLSSVDLLWAVQPADAYSLGELSAMSSFLAGGGRIAFMGEHGFFAPTENANISSAIATLGGHITINVDAPDGGFHNATVANGQILAHSLTTGVNTYNYAAFASLNVSGPAQTLMLGTNLSDVMMAYENIGPGSIFLITDQNVWDNVASTVTNDNHRMFENLLLAATGAPPVGAVPEPATLAILCLGLLGVGFTRRRTS